MRIVIEVHESVIKRCNPKDDNDAAHTGKMIGATVGRAVDTVLSRMLPIVIQTGASDPEVHAALQHIWHTMDYSLTISVAPNDPKPTGEAS